MPFILEINLCEYCEGGTHDTPFYSTIITSTTTKKYLISALDPGVIEHFKLLKPVVLGKDVNNSHEIDFRLVRGEYALVPPKRTALIIN